LEESRATEGEKSFLEPLFFPKIDGRGVAGDEGVDYFKIFAPPDMANGMPQK
jgi:hypothetical protein